MSESPPTARRRFGAFEALFLAVLVVFGLALLPDWIVWSSTRELIFEHPVGRPPAVVAVPGASVYRSGRLSQVLRERMDAAAAALEMWPEARLLLSGTGLPGGYDETVAMARYAELHGISPRRIRLDPRGRSTRATIANLERFVAPGEQVVVVSQRWHLARCLWMASQMHAFRVSGLAAGLPGRPIPRDRRIKEHLARIANFWQTVLRP